MTPTSLQDSVTYLASDAALASVAREPYWPKWDSPWWHMVLLHEIGQSHLIPAPMARAMAGALQTHYHPSFPLVESDLPEGIDPYRQLLCHCALGGILQALAGAGLPIDEAFPGARAWFLRYQLPDGGLNCDEAVYTRPTPRSSMVSSISPLEAVLYHTDRPFTDDEVAFLDAGARYYLERRLVRSISKGAVIDEAWLTPCFPRFYEYDVLRGLRFVATWAHRLNRPLPQDAVAETIRHLEAHFADPAFPTRPWAQAQRTIPASGDGPTAPASSFALLDEVSRPDVARTFLAAEWRRVQATLLQLTR